ncbi:viral a-type inclusion protein, partial [Lasius niger]
MEELRTKFDQLSQTVTDLENNDKDRSKETKGWTDTMNDYKSDIEDLRASIKKIEDLDLKDKMNRLEEGNKKKVKETKENFEEKLDEYKVEISNKIKTATDNLKVKIDEVKGESALKIHLEDLKTKFDQLNQTVTNLGTNDTQRLKETKGWADLVNNHEQDIEDLRKKIKKMEDLNLEDTITKVEEDDLKRLNQAKKDLEKKLEEYKDDISKVVENNVDDLKTIVDKIEKTMKGDKTTIDFYF